MNEQNKNIKICRFCGKNIKENEIICSSCGYNSETDTLTYIESLKKEKAKSVVAKSSGLRMFMRLIGITLIIILSIILFTGRSNNIISSITSLTQRFSKPKRSASIKRKSSRAAAKTTVSARLSNKSSLKKPTENIYEKFFKVEGILFDPNGKSFATINGEVVSEGDSIKKIKIIKINNDSIEIMVDGKNQILSVDQSIPLPKE